VHVSDKIVEVDGKKKHVIEFDFFYKFYKCDCTS